MKKILVVLNGKLPSQHLMSSAIEETKRTGSLLHAAFINYEIDLAEYNYPFPNDLSLTRNRLTGKTLEEENKELMDSHMRMFKDKCQAANIQFNIEEGNLTLGNLLTLSVFSDIIMVDGNEDIRDYHITDLMAKAHCPVYLVSRNVKQVCNVILAYDGSVSSMYSIRMFAYLFPEHRDLPVQLVHIYDEENVTLPEEEKVKLWATAHFPNMKIKSIRGDVSKSLVNHIRSVPDSLAVMGSFGRSVISRFFSGSSARPVIEDANSSVFIAHE